LRLKITLNDIEPAVLRRIEVPFDIRLDRLHLAIQAAMSWTNTHRDVGWGIPDRDWGDGPLDERLVDPEPGVLYPRLIEANGRCPPEDIGGPWGYAEFLEAIGDPKHERHAEFAQWVADDFDPNIVDADWLAKELATLAKRWSPETCRQRAAPCLNRGPHRRLTFQPLAVRASAVDTPVASDPAHVARVSATRPRSASGLSENPKNALVHARSGVIQSNWR
jgi:hypothetical protein